MRKDVKFGLTIGAFLVVTLVVYIIVLSQGGTKATNSADVKQVATAGGPVDANPTPTPLNAAPNPRDSAVTHDTGETHDASAETHTPAGGTPTTAPSVVTGQTDWNDVLQRGSVALDHSTPDRTITPTMGDSSANHPRVGSIEGHPLIDAPAAVSQNPLRIDVVAPNTGATVVGPTSIHVADVPMVIDTVPATQPATVVSGGARTHKVASGETLSMISKAAYGSAKYWDKILAANPNINPKNLKVGSTLVIPDLKTVMAVSAAAVGSDHGADLPTPNPNDTPAAAISNVDPTTTYVVASGDSLEKIALKLYGKPLMREALYQANKGVIGEDEDALKVGMVLKLPSAPTVGATGAMPAANGTSTTASR